MLELDRYLAEKAARIDAFLDAYLPTEDTAPEPIHRAVRYSLFAGGKRLRSSLVLAAAAAVGGDEDDALPCACAVEMVHTYSLIHDDLPAMDDDTVRRGKPTNHVVFGEAIAILAGDALLTHAFHVIAAGKGNLSPPRRLEAIEILSEAAGLCGLISGQVLDLESEGKTVTGATLELIHRNKTGALFSAAAQLGSVAGGGNEEETRRLARYGRELGLAFQIVDDILDVEGSTEVLGKTAGKDALSGKATYPRVHGMDEARRRAEELLETALSAIAPFEKAAEPLAALARRVVERRS